MKAEMPEKTLNTDCLKCGMPMPQIPPAPSDHPIYRFRFIPTGFLCPKCGHFNDLKGRNGWKEFKENLLPKESK